MPRQQFRLNPPNPQVSIVNPTRFHEWVCALCQKLVIRSSFTFQLFQSMIICLPRGVGTVPGASVNKLNPSMYLNSTKSRSCLISPQTAFPGGGAPRQLTSVEDGFTWLVRGLTFTTRREKNRARASWRHLPSAFSVKPGFSRFQDT